MIDIGSQPKPHWATLPRPGCNNVEYRLLLNQEGLLIANLRFAEQAEIDEHDAPIDIDVIVMNGSGFVSVGHNSAAIQAGQTIHWPRGKNHKLWTTTSCLETIMVERIYQLDT